MKRWAGPGFVLALAGAVAAWAAVAAQGSPLEMAMAQSKQTGLPMLVLVVTDTCPHCAKLRQRLATEPELRQLLTHYVPIELNADSPDFKLWAQHYKPGGNGVPLIYIVGSDGKEIYNKSGAPQGDGVKQLLAMGIAQTGGPKKIEPERPGKTAPGGKNVLAGMMRKIDALLARDKKAEVIALVAPHAEQAAGDEKLGPMIRQWTKEATDELDKAKTQLASADDALAGLAAVLATERVYGRLPGVKEPAAKLLDEVKQDPQKKELLAQAEALDKARALEDRGSERGAAAAYRGVIAKYPDTPAAQLAQKRLDAMGAKPTATVASRPASSDGPASSGGTYSNQKKASSYLRMAKTFAATRPDKAKEYAGKVVELMPPASPEAQEAKQLIERLQ